jgi:Uncharacterized protein conserved in bacteria (DUF2188)
MGKNVHITHDKSHKAWNVKEEGNSSPRSSHRTQSTAIDAGRDVARRNQSELVIHNRDNVIRDKDSYGNDPCPPKDRKH